MNIYVSHSRDFDFKKELYEPIKESSLSKKYNFCFPHENNDELFDSKNYLKEKADLVIAEVSYPKIAIGIELGWANSFNIPIICIHKKSFKLSNSLIAVTKDFIEYANNEELVEKLRERLKTNF